MQDMIILGLLSLKPFTLYELQNVAAEKIGLFYNTSAGSIHPALKKLNAQKLVEVRQEVANGRAKKIYNITAGGKEKFRSWMESEIASPKIRDEAVLRMFWFSEISKEGVLKILGEYLKNVSDVLAQLEGLKENHLKDLPEESKNPRYYFQMKTLDLGIAYHEFLKNWYGELADEIENRNLWK
jgi:DNA-binding PadR family transcriptional regulator